MVIALISRSFTRNRCWESFHCHWRSRGGTNKLPPIFLSHTRRHLCAPTASPLDPPGSTSHPPCELSLAKRLCFSMLHSKSEYTHGNTQVSCYLKLHMGCNLDWNKNYIALKHIFLLLLFDRLLFISDFFPWFWDEDNTQFWHWI